MIDNSKWIGSPAHDVVMERYFPDDLINVQFDVEGMRVKDNRLTLGMRAGPSRCLTNLIHEMCHLVEIDDARILSSGWGLTTPTQYIPGRYSHNAPIPVTWQPIKREVRVIAMQWQLETSIGVGLTKREALAAMEYMPDWCNVPDGRPDNYDEMEWQERDVIRPTFDETRFAHLEAYMNECIAGKWTLTFFNDEWKRKTELLRAAQVIAA